MMKVIEGIQGYLKFLKEHLADCAAAAVETSHAVAQMAETLPAVTRMLGEVVDRLDSIDDRLNRYISDQAQQDGKVARLEKHVSEVRERVNRVAGG